MSVQLRHYQTSVIERARQRIAEGKRRVLLVAPTGAGKTHVSSEIARCCWVKGKRILFIAHRRRLIEQKAERLDMFGVPYGIIMDGYPSKRTLPVQVASRDTLLSRCVRNEWSELPPADLVIVDEAHNWMSDECQKLLARYANAIVLGLTATPCRSDGKGLGDYFEALECTVPVSQLIAEGFLVPVRCFDPGLGAKDKKGLTGDPVAHWKMYAEERPTVIFASRVSASLAVVKQFLDAGIPAEHIDADTPDDERDRIIWRVQTGKTLAVSNVGIWTEGVDIPELAVCQLLRGCTSYVLFAQAVGRVMRPSPGKEDAILIDHAGAVRRHGFPDEDVEWSLDQGEAVEARIRQAKKCGEMKTPITCPACGHQFHSSLQCPACGKVMKRKGKREANRDGLLFEVERGNQQYASSECRTRYWQQCIGVAVNTGRKASSAAVMYKARFGVWPESHGHRDVPRGNDCHRPASEVFHGFNRKSEAVA